MLLAGPAFALNVLLLATLGAHIGVHYLVDEPGALIEALVPLAAIVGTVAVGFSPWLWFPETRWSFWLIGPLALGVGVITRRSLDLRPFTDATVWMLEWLIAAIVCILLLNVMTFVIGRVLRLIGRSSMTTVLAVCLQFGFWAALVPLTWRIILKWMPSRAHEPWMDELFQRAVRSDGVQWVMTVVVVVALFVVVCFRELVKRTKARPAQASSIRW